MIFAVLDQSVKTIKIVRLEILVPYGMLLLLRYDFNSWREFSYLDEENPDKAEW